MADILAFPAFPQPEELEGLERAMESIQDNERGTLDLTRDIGERWYFDPE
mgnify:CR=1 FL=1